MFNYFLTALTSVTCVAFAAPEGFNLIAGDAKPPVIDSKGAMTIKSGKHAIVHWDKFSIDKNASVHFVQADGSSAILNRVVGFSKSQIDGALLSNGKVFLINKNGVVIGPNGRIETAGFIASTLDVANEDFLKGKELLFKGDSVNKVVNLGTIVASDGDVVLIGQNVDNQGDIRALKGHVLLGCGQEILLQPQGQEQMFIRIPAAASQEDPQSANLEHSGTVEALVTEFKSGITPYAKAIKSSGKIDALALHEEGGKVFLVAEKGRVDVSGQIVAKQGDKGGNIQLLAKEVYVLDGANIDASGDMGGGQILVGGDYQGKNPDILNADLSFVGKDAILKANAITDGDGGKVIVWSDNATGFFGNIEAKGGANTGNGGLVEVSGKFLEFKGFSDTRAPNGQCGQLLLDPVDITILGTGDTGGSFVGGTWTPTCTAGTNPNNINNSDLISQFASNNVTISSFFCTSPSIATAGGTITFNEGISYNSGNSFTINAASDLIIGPNIIENFGAGSFNFSTSGNFSITGGGALTTGGNIQVVANNSASITGGSIITSTGGSVVLVVDNANPTSPTIGSGALTIDSTSSVSGTTATELYTASLAQDTITGTIGTPPTTFTGQNVVQNTYFNSANPVPAGTGVPFTVFVKTGAPPPPPPPAPAPAGAAATTAVSNTALGNIVASYPAVIFSILIRNPPYTGGPARPLTEFGNHPPMSDIVCPW